MLKKLIIIILNPIQFRKNPIYKKSISQDIYKICQVHKCSISKQHMLWMSQATVGSGPKLTHTVNNQ